LTPRQYSHDRGGDAGFEAGRNGFITELSRLSNTHERQKQLKKDRKGLFSLKIRERRGRGFMKA